MLHETIDLTLHPEWDHGRGGQPPFFEGWSFKLVSADQQQRYTGDTDKRLGAL